MDGNGVAQSVGRDRVRSLRKGSSGGRGGAGQHCLAAGRPDDVAGRPARAHGFDCSSSSRGAVNSSVDAAAAVGGGRGGEGLPGASGRSPLCIRPLSRSSPGQWHRRPGGSPGQPAAGCRCGKLLVVADRLHATAASQDVLNGAGECLGCRPRRRTRACSGRCRTSARDVWWRRTSGCSPWPARRSSLRRSSGSGGLGRRPRLREGGLGGTPTAFSSDREEK